MTRHNAGPWRTVEEGQRVMVYAKDSAGANVIITAVHTGFGDEADADQLANARLIAAAPALQDALHDLVKLAEGAGLDGACIHGQHSGRAATLDVARAALALTESHS